MGKITINELHKSLFNYVQAASDDRLETKNKTIVGAINELISNNNNDTELNNLINEISNGKQLIANAIGEPLTAEDSFNEMSDDINSLLSTFKTNMMNNGVTVESSDRFKQLIDKIATMVEEGSDKGVKFAEGVYSLNRVLSAKTTITVPLNVDFTPTIIFAILNEYTVGATGYVIDNVLATSFGKFTAFTDGGLAHSILITEITKESFKLTTNCKQQPSDGNTQINWYAIGVGEEDTTRGGLDIISATELPATGRENQICVITDNPVDSFLLTPDKTSNNDTSYITVYTGDSSTHNNVKVELNNNNILQNYYFYRTTQGGTRLASYIYQNNNWTQLTISTVVFYSQGAFYNTNIHGGLYGGNSYLRNDGEVLTEGTSATRTYASFNNKIDFSQFNYARISGYTNFENGGIRISATDAKSNSGTRSGNLLYESKEHAITTNPTTVTIDISGYNDIAYLTLNLYASANHVNVSITDIEFY